MDLAAVILAILSLFVLIGAGYFARRHGLLGDTTVYRISHVLVNIAIPALTLSSMQVPRTSESMGTVDLTLGIAFAYYIGAFFFSLLVCHFLPATRREKGVFQFMLVFPNVGFMGIPVSEVILGPDSLFYVILFNLPFNLLVFTVGVWLLAHERPERPDIRLLLTPGLIASIAGLGLFFIGYDIPFPADVALDWIGKTTTPLAMIVVGALLATLPVSRLAGDWRIGVISALRLLVLPVLTWIILSPFITDRLLLATTVLLVAMPVAANTVLLSEEYEVDATLASQGVFLSTVLCCATIPIIEFFFL